MTSTTRFFFASLFLVSGCAASAAPSEESLADEQEITGVSDLTELETAFGFHKDARNASGVWGRPDARVTRGPCYRRTIGGPDGASYQLRRYAEGAAFFKKLGAGAASGDERPVVCVDYDIVFDGEAETLALDDFEVDSAIRYRLGAPVREEGAAGSTYQAFEHGHIRWANQLCDETPFVSLAPSAVDSGCLSSLAFPGSGGTAGAVAAMVYQFAYKRGLAQDRFSTKNDAVGRFINAEGELADQHLRFERFDAHHIERADGTEVDAITPKGSDGAIEANALMVCVRARNAPRASCRGA